MSPNQNCIFCGQAISLDRLGNTTCYQVRCNTCGVYISDGFNDERFIRMPPEDKAMISAYTREIYENGLPIPMLNVLDNEEKIPMIVERYSKKTVIEKLDNLISYLSNKSSYFGMLLHFHEETDFPITYSRNQEECANIVIQAGRAGFIEPPMMGGYAQLTWKGWEKYIAIKEEKGEASINCFVAMPCAEELRQIYEEGIKKAIEVTGYNPVFIEKEEHNEKICDLVLAEIKASRFIIADVTLQRQNVYYEAGFAQGLRKDVIWSCRSDDIINAHFDTRQYNHIVWENADDIRKKLINRIKATIL